MLAARSGSTLKARLLRQFRQRLRAHAIDLDARRQRRQLRQRGDAGRRELGDLRTANAGREERAVVLAPLGLTTCAVVALCASGTGLRFGNARLFCDEAFEAAHETPENKSRAP